MAEEKILGAKQVARRLGVEARILRKFLRSDASPYNAVGQGARYNFKESEVKRIKLYFDAWRNGAKQIDHQAIERPKKSRAKAEVTLGTAPTDEELAYDDGTAFDDRDPLPEELDELDDELAELTLEDLEDGGAEADE